MVSSIALARGRTQRKTWCMEPYPGVQSRIQHIYHGQPSVRVDLNPILCQSRLYAPVRDFGFGLRGYPAGRWLPRYLPPPHSFFSCSQNWDSPNPSPAGECAPPPTRFRGEGIK
jgi:hypothetical protein